MGKIKRTRTKFHLSAPKPENQENSNIGSGETSSAGLFLPLPVSSKTEDASLRDCKDKEDAKETKTKKDRRRLRREKFLAKLNTSYQAKVTEEAAKKRAKTAVIGDMQPLFDALPDIKALFERSLGESKGKRRVSTSTKEVTRKGKPKSSRARMRANLDDIQRFQKVSEDASFKANPEIAISSHVKYLMEREDIS